MKHFCKWRLEVWIQNLKKKLFIASESGLKNGEITVDEIEYKGERWLNILLIKWRTWMHQNWELKQKDSDSKEFKIEKAGIDWANTRIF